MSTEKTTMSLREGMTKQSEVLLPALRFKEFDNAWCIKNLEDVCEMKAGNFVSASEIFKNEKNGLFPCYGGNGLRGYTLTFNREGKYSLIGRQGAHCGNVKLVNGSFHATEHALVVELNKAYDTGWVFFLLYQSNLNQYSTGLAQPGLSVKNLEKVKVSITLSLPEQQKIASFLSAVDEKIQQLTKKKALLEQYKKGVMQQLFSGQLRFKDENGQDYADWEEKRLGDVGKVKMCKRIFSHQTAEIGDIPFYKIGTFGKEADAFIPNELFQEFKEKYSYPKIGEILMSASGTLGRTVIYDGSEAYFQDSNIVWIENNEELITNSFLFYVYQVVRYDSEGGTIQRLYNSIISAAKFLKPSLEEQQKVTSLLSSIDSKIESVKNQINQTQSFKKGLLQQMFI